MRRQPLPKEGQVEVMPLVVADLLRRSAQGARKYGRPLQTHNGRDALWDLYEELLDAVQYLRQAIEERDRGEGVSPANPGG